MRLTRLCLCPCVCVMVGCAQVLAFFTARIAQENLESPSPEDILRVLAKNVDAWKSEGQARARLKASLLVRGGWASFWRPRSWDRGGLGGPRGFQEMPELRFRYEEEPNAEEFFCPFVWELAVNHPAFRFQSPAIKLFRQVGHACVWARAIGCAVCLTRNGWTVGRVLIISLLLQLPPRPAPPRRHRRRTSALPSVSTFRSLYKQKTTWSSQSTRSAGGVRGWGAWVGAGSPCFAVARTTDASSGAGCRPRGRCWHGRAAQGGRVRWRDGRRVCVGPASGFQVLRLVVVLSQGKTTGRVEPRSRAGTHAAAMRVHGPVLGPARPGRARARRSCR